MRIKDMKLSKADMNGENSVDLFEQDGEIVGDPKNSPYYNAEFEEAYKRNGHSKITWQQLHDNAIVVQHG